MNVALVMLSIATVLAIVLGLFVFLAWHNLLSETRMQDLNHRINNIHSLQEGEDSGTKDSEQYAPSTEHQ